MMIMTIVKAIIKAFRALRKDNKLQPYMYQMMISDLQTLGLMTLDINICFRYKTTEKLYKFPTIKEEFKFDGVVPDDKNGYILVLTNKLVSVSSGGQHHFDLY